MIRTAMLAAVAMTTVTAAHASPGAGSAPTKHVTYRDLNLATQEGQEKFERRIQGAANEVCLPFLEVPGSLLGNKGAFARCRQFALADVHPQMLAAIQRASGVAGVDRPIVVASR